MISDEYEFKLREGIRKRKAAFYRLIEEQRLQLEEGGKHLIWERRSEQSNYDAVIIFSPRGYVIMESLTSLINQSLPQLILEKKAHTNKNEQALYIAGDKTCLEETALLMGLSCKDDTKEKIFLTSLQRQIIIRYYLNTLRWFSESNTFGESFIRTIKLVDGDTIIPKLIKYGFIKQILPLHHGEDLKLLRLNWVSAFFSSQPLQDIHEYFGIKIAMYFAFLGYYTAALTVPSLFCIPLYLFSLHYEIGDDVIKPIYAVFIIIWSSIYLRAWKAYAIKLSSKWSWSGNNLTVFNIRPQFHGNIVRKPGEMSEVYVFYPDWKRKLFFYCITIPIMLLSLVVVFLTMLYMLHFQNWWDTVAINEHSYPEWTSYLPKVVFGIMIHFLNVIYHKIAVWLNFKENYQYEEMYETNLLIKLVPFQFVNSFLSLFYIAFYIGDINKLKEQLVALLITRQVIGNLKESIWPFLTQSYRVSRDLNHSSISQAELESSLFKYESTFEDYLELFIQFGYVTLFSCTFQYAAFCAFLNNLIEIRSDAFKLCVTYQRPFSVEGVENTIVWQKAMNVMVYIAIVVNCALMAKSGYFHRLFPSLDNVHIIIGCVILEHILIIIKLAIEKINFKRILTLFEETYESLELMTNPMNGKQIEKDDLSKKEN